MPNEDRHRVSPLALGHARELRKDQTAAERLLWSALRNAHLGGLKFRRQHPMGRFIVDFYCASRRLVIEVDGDTHVDTQVYDQRRTEWLAAQGCQVVRFTNDEVHRNLRGVLQAILDACGEETPSP